MKYSFLLETTLRKSDLILVLRRIANEIEKGSEVMSDYDEAHGIVYWEMKEEK